MSKAYFIKIRHYCVVTWASYIKDGVYKVNMTFKIENNQYDDVAIPNTCNQQLGVLSFEINNAPWCSDWL